MVKDFDIYFDGKDWIHTDKDVCLVYPEQYPDFRNLCTDHIPLFTKTFYHVKAKVYNKI